MVAIGISILLGIIFLFLKSAKKELNMNAENVPENVSQWAPIAWKYSRKYGVPFDIVLSVIKVESAGDQYARGSAGEWGLMQLKDIAVRDVRELQDPEIDLEQYKTDPDENIRAGVAFLKLQYRRTGDWFEAIKAYNQGLRGKDKYPERAQSYLNKVQEFRSIL